MSSINYQIACQKIISGGQTGVDRGALDACIKHKFNCGGWCPKGRKAEDGVIPEQYPLIETPDLNHESRTHKNVSNAYGTLIISPGYLNGGTFYTFHVARVLKKPNLIISPDESEILSLVTNIVSWINKNSIQVLNVAGPRKSEWQAGYNLSYQIISALIYEIKKSAS